jgi:hypothetical protein
VSAKLLVEGKVGKRDANGGVEELRRKAQVSDDGEKRESGKDAQ